MLCISKVYIITVFFSNTSRATANQYFWKSDHVSRYTAFEIQALKSATSRQWRIFSGLAFSIASYFIFFLRGYKLAAT